VKILTTNEVVYTSLAYREPGQVKRASSIVYSAGGASIPTGVVHILPRDKSVTYRPGSADSIYHYFVHRHREGESEKVCLHGVLPSMNTIVLPCDLHWDVTGITKSDSPPLPAVFTTSRRPILRRTTAA
jgi:hypothetical protein